MSEKHLAEAGWKTLVTKLKLKDPGLGKALAAFEKFQDDQFEGALKALDVVDKEVAAAKKDASIKGNKEAEAYLGEIATESGKRRKLLDEKQSKAESSEDEGEEGSADPATIKKKLTALLSTVKQKAPEDEPLHFLAALGKGEAAVMLGKTLGGSTKKLLLQIVPTLQGPKFVTGDCRWEENAYTFILDQVPGGLAKLLQKALFNETGIKHPVRVRSTDGSVTADSDTEEESTEAETDEATPQNAQADFTARLRALKPQIDKAMAGTSPEAAEIKRLFGEVVGHARQQAFGPAAEGLGAIEKLLTGTGTPQPGPEKTADDPKLQQLQAAMAKLRPSVERATETNPNSADDLRQMLAQFDQQIAAGQSAEARETLMELAALVKGFASAAPQTEGTADRPANQNVLFTQARLRWDTTRKQVQAELQRFEQVILDASTEEEDFSEIATKAQGLYRILETLDTSLIDKLDEAYSATTPEAKARAQQEAGGIIKGYVSFVTSDPLMSVVDKNAFGDFDVRANVTNALTELEQKLA